MRSLFFCFAVFLAGCGWNDTVKDVIEKDKVLGVQPIGSYYSTHIGCPHAFLVHYERGYSIHCLY